LESPQYIRPAIMSAVPELKSGSQGVGPKRFCRHFTETAEHCARSTAGACLTGARADHGDRANLAINQFVGKEQAKSPIADNDNISMTWLVAHPASRPSLEGTAVRLEYRGRVCWKTGSLGFSRNLHSGNVDLG
jgi:hypothetical protein